MAEMQHALEQMGVKGKDAYTEAYGPRPDAKIAAVPRGSLHLVV